MAGEEDTTAAVTGADLQRAVAAIEKSTNGSWLARHQTWTIAIVGVIVGSVSWGVNRWTREQVLEVQAPIDAKQDERTDELKTGLSVERNNREVEAARLRQNDEDFVDYLRESDRYDRTVLEKVAEKVRVKDGDLPDRAPLKRAAKRLDAIKERGRAR